MGADIKALKGRIRSVDSTLHLTRAMGLVASSKMRRANEAMNHGREYVKAFGEAVALLAGSPECA
jgi:F-type H+-transporting ATPase subunit gamma